MIKLDGYELILGSSIDPQFGPVLLFGTGGQLVEVFKDRALALPPLNTTLARRMMEQTRIFTALKGVRGRPAGRPRRAGTNAGALQPARRRAAAGSRKSTSTRCWLRPNGCWPSMPAWSCTPPDDRGDNCPGPPSARIPAQYVCHWQTAATAAGRHPSDPPRGRAADGEVPRDALGTNRLSALLQHAEAEPARRPRAAHAHLLQ